MAREAESGTHSGSHGVIVLDGLVVLRAGKFAVREAELKT